MGVYYIGSIPCSSGDIYHYGRKGMKWGKNIFGKISEFFTGNNARSSLNAARANQRGYNTQNRLAAKYDYHDVDNNGSALNWNAEKRNMGKNPKGYGGSISARERVQNAQAAYDKTLPGMMAKAREQVSKAYSDAASSLSGKGLDIQSFYSQVMQKAQGAINRGKSMVTKYGGQFVSQIQTLGNNALAGGKSFLEGIMKKVKQAKSKATEPISRKKGQEGEIRARVSEIGKQNTHDMLRGRRNYTQQFYKNENKWAKDHGWTSLADTNHNSLAEERSGRKLYRPKARKAEKLDAEYDVGHKDNRDYRNKNNNLNQKIRRNTNYAQRLVENEYEKRGYGPNNPAPDNFMRDVLRRDEEERLARQRKK